MYIQVCNVEYDPLFFRAHHNHVFRYYTPRLAQTSPKAQADPSTAHTSRPGHLDNDDDVTNNNNGE